MEYCKKKNPNLKHINEIIIAADYVWKKNYISWDIPKIINCWTKSELISKYSHINKFLLCHLHLTNCIIIYIYICHFSHMSVSWTKNLTMWQIPHTINTVDWSLFLIFPFDWIGCSHDVMIKVLDCGLDISEF